MARALVGCLLLAALLAVGCGGGSGSSQEPTSRSGGEASIEEFGEEAGGAAREALLTSFEGYLRAIAAGDTAKACSRLSTTVHASLEQVAGRGLAGKGCAAVLSRLLAPTAGQVARAQANGEVTRVRVEGSRAFVIFHAPGAELYELAMLEQGGEWKAATVSAGILVPDL